VTDAAKNEKRRREDGKERLKWTNKRNCHAQILLDNDEDEEDYEDDYNGKKGDDGKETPRRR